MPTPVMMSIPIMRFGRKKNTVSPPLRVVDTPQRWERLLEEQNQCIKEVEDAFSAWLDRHQGTVRESKKWKEAHGQLAEQLSHTEMELVNTKRQLHDLQQHQVTLSPSMNSNQNCQGSNNWRCPKKTTLPIVLRNAAHSRKHKDEYSLERHDLGDKSLKKDSNRKEQELQSKMESYQVILDWQERQTEQWRSRCNRQFSQIESLLATVERQKIELEQEKEQCDVLIDAVYHLIKQKEEEDPIKANEEPPSKKVEHYTRKTFRSVSTYPEEFFCPLTRQLFVDPVIDHEGNSYEKKAILEWLELNETSPLTRNLLCKDQLIPNRAVKHAIAGWHKR